VDKANSLRANIGSFQGSDEELIVSLVDGIATLEGQHILALWQSGANLCWGSTREHPLGQLQALHLATWTSSLLLRVEKLKKRRSESEAVLGKHKGRPSWAALGPPPFQLNIRTVYSKLKQRG
jgi:hypothetical protein